MKSKWMSMGAAALLGLAAIAAGVPAQERPGPVARAAAGDELEDLGGIEDLLAADVGPGDGAKGPSGRRGHVVRERAGRGAARDGFRAELDLSEQQKTRLADIRERRVRAAIPIQGDLRVASLDLRKLMRADKPDASAINAQIDRIASLRASLHKSRVASALEARAVLTPAQQKLMREHRGGGMGLHMGDGRHRRGGPGMRMRHL